MVCLGLEPGAAGWKTQTNPLSYGGTPKIQMLRLIQKFGAKIFLVKYFLNRISHSISFVLGIGFPLTVALNQCQPCLLLHLSLSLCLLRRNIYVSASVYCYHHPSLSSTYFLSLLHLPLFFNVF